MSSIEYWKKGDSIVLSADGSNGYPVIREISNDEKKEIDNHSLNFIDDQLFMHYWADNIEYDEEDPVWQNTSLYFWKAEEPFPNKALPAIFEDFEKIFFVINKPITIEVSLATPWFDQPGLGEKHVAVTDHKMFPLLNLYRANVINYVEVIETLCSKSLNDSKYGFLVDERIVSLENSKLYLDGQDIPYHIAYSIGGIHLVKIESNTNLL